jgi:SAM-dependent methyltransferase
MSAEIIGLRQWFETPPGQYLLEWEREHFNSAVTDIFGYHALQLGLPDLDTLHDNRMPHKWMATPRVPMAMRDGVLQPALVTDFSALPFPEASLDLVVLPHTLELSHDPHATLREVERVLVPEGRVVISCLNPASLWGLRQRRAHLYQYLGFGQLYLPPGGDFLGYWRMRDWLRLLSFEVESAHFGCYRPALRSAKWLNRYAWMDQVGARWWPIFGAVYFLVAVKRVRGMRLMGPAWKSKAAIATAPISVANQTRSHRTPKEPELESH